MSATTIKLKIPVPEKPLTLSDLVPGQKLWLCLPPPGFWADNYWREIPSCHCTCIVQKVNKKTVCVLARTGYYSSEPDDYQETVFPRTRLDKLSRWKESHRRPFDPESSWFDGFPELGDDSAARLQAYRDQLIAKGIHPETADRAALILMRGDRTSKEQNFMSEVWALLFMPCPA